MPKEKYLFIFPFRRT